MVDRARHESEDRLELYALGRLRGSEVAEIEEHLFVCAACREKLDSIADFAICMREELKAHPLPARRPFFEWLIRPQPRFAFAGAFAVAILALGFYWLRPGTTVAPLATLQLTAMRGEMQTVAATRELDLTFSDAAKSAGPFRVEVVDGSGAAVWKGIPDAASGGLQAKLKDRLSPGDYFVRLYGGNGGLVHEYGFRVRD